MLMARLIRVNRQGGPEADEIHSGLLQQRVEGDPSLKGKVEIEFTIGENGRIEEALTVGNTMGNKTVMNCILRMLKRWKFPKPDGGSVTVVFPFIFSS